MIRGMMEKMQVHQWLVEWMADEMGIATTEVDVVCPFVAMECSAEQMRLLLSDLEHEFAVRVEPAFVWQYSVEILAAYVAKAGTIKAMQADIGAIYYSDGLYATGLREDIA